MSAAANQTLHWLNRRAQRAVGGCEYAWPAAPPKARTEAWAPSRTPTQTSRCGTVPPAGPRMPTHSVS